MHYSYLELAQLDCHRVNNELIGTVQRLKVEKLSVINNINFKSICSGFFLEIDNADNSIYLFTGLISDDGCIDLLSSEMVVVNRKGKAKAPRSPELPGSPLSAPVTRYFTGCPCEGAAQGGGANAHSGETGEGVPGCKVHHAPPPAESLLLV